MDKYTIFGNPINHSLSPKIHKYFAKQTGHLISYEKVLAPRDDFEGYVRDFVNSGGRGFNATVPFKIESYNLSDKLTTHAKRAGAVNTVKIEDGKLYGHNTDGIGLVTDLCKNLEQTVKDKDILVLGAGGATKGILLPLLEQKPTRILLANRTKSKALDLANNYSKFGKVGRVDSMTALSTREKKMAGLLVGYLLKRAKQIYCLGLFATPKFK